MFVCKYDSFNMNTDDACKSTYAPFGFCAFNNVFDFKDTAAKTVSFFVIALLNFYIRITNPVVIKAAGAVES